MSDPDPKGASRFSTMAHLFLSEIRTDRDETGVPVKKDEKTEVRRVGPNPRATDPENDETGEEKKLHVVGVYGHHLNGEGNLALRQFARALAGQGNRVAILQREGRFAHLRLYHQKSTPSILKTPGKTAEGTVFDHLDRLAESLDYLLIPWGTELGRYEKQGGSLGESLCVLVSPDPQTLVGSYQAIKTLSGEGADRPIGIFVADVERFSQAQSVYGKLEKTARDFAGIQLENFGYRLSDGDGTVADELLVRSELPEPPENWFAGLAEWLKNHRAAPRDELKVQSEKVRETQPPAAPVCAVGDDDNLMMLEGQPGAGPMAELIGQALCPDGRGVNDSLILFLQSAGLDCARFQDSEGHGTLILVLPKGDPTLPAWAMAHYPQRPDSLIVVTEGHIGRFEKDAWFKEFPRLAIQRMIRGTLGGRPIILVEKIIRG